jgi:hypothetical protein
LVWISKSVDLNLETKDPTLIFEKIQNLVWIQNPFESFESNPIQQLK